MRKVIFCKYNYNRAPKYQTKTTIFSDEDKRYIEKYPLNDEAFFHMQSFLENYEKVKNIYPKVKFIQGKKIENGICYDYIEGVSLDEVIKRKYTDWNEKIRAMKTIIDEIYVPTTAVTTEFKMTDGFRKIFGDIDCSGDVCVCPCNLDVIFDNLMVVENKIIGFDYEWVYDFPVPNRYVIYRVLCRFYDKNLHEIEKYYTFEEYAKKFEYDEKELKKYRKMEDAFILNIYAEGDSIYTNTKYICNRKTFAEISIEEQEHEKLKKDYDKAISEYNKVIEVLHKTEDEYRITIDRLNNAAKMKMAADEKICSLNQMIQEQQGLLAENKKVYEENQQKLQTLQQEISCLMDSTSWKITKPLRWVKKKLFTKRNKENLEKNQKMVKSQPDDLIKEALLSYVEVSEKLKESQTKEKFTHNYKISIVTPLFNTPTNFLIDVLESVMAQTYSNWEFCIVNFSTNLFDEVDKICQEYAKKDARISYHVAKENLGISANTNICISYATGEYIGLLDHDDILHPCALYEVVKAINENNADFLYTDEVKFSENVKNVFMPNLKPDFTEDELRAHNFVCHFNVYSKKLYNEVGGYREKFDGSQDHDMVLRLTEKAHTIVHIPKILYYWRVHQNSVACNIEAKSYATDAGEKAVTEQFKRMGYKQYAKSVVNNIPLYRFWLDDDERVPDVTVVLWGGRTEDYRITCHSLNKLKNIKYIVLSDKEGISMGEQWNETMKRVKTRYVWFIRGGLYVQSESLLNELNLYRERKDIATIDCKIYDEKKRIFSGGAYISGDVGMPVKLRCMGGAEDYSGYENGMLHIRPVTVTTGLCTLVDMLNWKEVKGFEQTKGMSAMLYYSNVQRQKGKVNIWTPFVKAYGANDICRGESIEQLSTLSNIFGMQDPYLNEKVNILKLE